MCSSVVSLTDEHKLWLMIDGGGGGGSFGPTLQYGPSQGPEREIQRCIQREGPPSCYSTDTW